MKQASGSNWYKVRRTDVRRQTSSAQIHFFAVLISNSLFFAAAVDEPTPQLSCGVNGKFAR
jgi:hypothetical protein